MRLAIMLIVSIATSAICTAQTTWYVPDDYTTIQGAISNASVVDGDTVFVRPGTYVENIDFLGKDITVRSEQGPSNTIIDGAKKGSTVIFNNGESGDAILEGFTIRNGSGTYDTTWNLYTGGGILCNSSSPCIRNNVIKNNNADFGGGIACAYYSIDNAIIYNNTIEKNSALGGGGIACWLASPEIKSNIIFENTAEDGGGINSGDCNSEISHNSIIFNVAEDGAGILTGYGSQQILYNDISFNLAKASDGGIGGGIAIREKGTHHIAFNHISNNESNSTGGGIWCQDAQPIIESNMICRNRVTPDPSTGNGGTGGGIDCWDASVTLINNIIAYNQATSNYWGGGGISAFDSQLTIFNNTFWENSSNLLGGGILCDDSIIEIYNTILWNNNAPSGPEIWSGWSFSSSTTTISYSDVKGGQSSVYVEPGSILNWGLGMIDANPQFVDPSNCDFHIKYISSCRDTGVNSASGLPAEDFEGDPRIAFGTVDMGADEFYPHLYLTGNTIPTGNVEIKFIGLPGDLINGLLIGVNIFDPPLPCDYGLWYMNNPFQIMTGFGSIPLDGIKVFSGTIPGTTPAPMTVYLQAAIDSWLTNLCTVNVQ